MCANYVVPSENSEKYKQTFTKNLIWTDASEAGMIEKEMHFFFFSEVSIYLS